MVWPINYDCLLTSGNWFLCRLASAVFRNLPLDSTQQLRRTARPYCTVHKLTAFNDFLSKTSFSAQIRLSCTLLGNTTKIFTFHWNTPHTHLLEVALFWHGSFSLQPDCQLHCYVFLQTRSQLIWRSQRSRNIGCSVWAHGRVGHGNNAQKLALLSKAWKSGCPALHTEQKGKPCRITRLWWLKCCFINLLVTAMRLFALNNLRWILIFAFHIVPNWMIRLTSEGIWRVMHA